MIREVLVLTLSLAVAASALGQPSKDSLSTTDRAQGERFLGGLQQRFQEIAREPNAVVRDEKISELNRSLKTLEGTMVAWEYPVRFSPDGRSVVLDLAKRLPYQIATSNYGDFLLDALTPQLRLGRELDAAAFRKLKGGEAVTFKGMLSADLTQFGVAFKLVGRIVKDPFGQAIKVEPFQAKSTWAGQCVAGRNRYSLKIAVTDRTGDTLRGTCTDLKGFRAYQVTGKIDGDKAELTIHRGNEREPFPYFTTFTGTITDGFLMKGTFPGGVCLFSLMD